MLVSTPTPSIEVSLSHVPLEGFLPHHPQPRFLSPPPYLVVGPPPSHLLQSTLNPSGPLASWGDLQHESSLCCGTLSSVPHPSLKPKWSQHHENHLPAPTVTSFLVPSAPADTPSLPLTGTLNATHFLLSLLDPVRSLALFLPPRSLPPASPNFLMALTPRSPSLDFSLARLQSFSRLTSPPPPSDRPLALHIQGSCPRRL